MLTIEDNAISLTRGDTGYIYIEIEGYEPNPEDTITLTVRKQISDEQAKLSITVPIDQGIVIKPQDTKTWDYGRYYYDIQIDTSAGEVFTIIEKSPFKITEEVTR